MAKPDDDHEPRALVGDDGEVVAIVHVSPGAGPEVDAALRALVAAVRERMEAEDTPERQARRDAGQARLRALQARLRGGG